MSNYSLISRISRGWLACLLYLSCCYSNQAIAQSTNAFIFLNSDTPYTGPYAATDYGATDSVGFINPSATGSGDSAGTTVNGDQLNSSRLSGGIVGGGQSRDMGSASSEGFTVNIQESDHQTAFDESAMRALTDIDFNLQSIGLDSGASYLQNFGSPILRTTPGDLSYGDMGGQLQEDLGALPTSDLGYNTYHSFNDQPGVAGGGHNLQFNGSDEGSDAAGVPNMLTGGAPVYPMRLQGSTSAQNLWQNGMGNNNAFNSEITSPYPSYSPGFSSFTWHFISISTAGGTISGTPMDINVPIELQGTGLVSEGFSFIINLLVVTYAYFRMVYTIRNL